MGILSNAREHLRTLRNLTRSRIRLNELQGAMADVHAKLNEYWATMAELRARIGNTDDVQHQVEDLKNRISTLETSVAGAERAFEHREAGLLRDITALHRIVEIQRQSYVDITRKLSQSEPAGKDAKVPKALSQDPFLDVFYRELEDRYRGSREEILERMRVYIPHLEDLKAMDTVKYPAVDIACGRGEWLEILQEEGINAMGVDINAWQVKDAQDMGLSIEIADALEWLSARRARSVSLISMMQIIEHLDFPTLVQVLKESMRVLRPGGKLLLETPNPESLIVGAYKFWMDPTHVRPYPPQVISRLLESLAFDQIEILRLHPDGRNREYKTEYNMAPAVADLLAGPLDYAILCRRP